MKIGIKDEIKKHEFFRVVIKHGILVPITIISTFISAIIGIVFVRFFGQDYPFVIGAAFSFDCSVSSLCIYLLFAFNDDIYAKLCWIFHGLCEKSKLNKIEKSMQSVTVGSDISPTTNSSLGNEPE